MQLFFESCLSAVFCIYSGLLRDGYELISQALALFTRVCGILHEDTCMCLRLLGRLSYLMEEYPDVRSVLGRHLGGFFHLMTR